MSTIAQSSSSTTSKPHITITVDGSDVQEPYRDDPESAKMDEEEMRRANQDVMQMQQQMIDGRSINLYRWTV